MTENEYFSPEERALLPALVRDLATMFRGQVTHQQVSLLRRLITNGVQAGKLARDAVGFNPVVRRLKTAKLLAECIAPDANIVIAMLLFDLCDGEVFSEARLVQEFGEDVRGLVRGIRNVVQLYGKRAVVTNENYPKLLITFADDIRVIIVMIINRLSIMYDINHHPNEQYVHEISNVARYLYAPLAHRLGLYKVKRDLEDLSLKYLNRDLYTQIARKLHETKKARDKYVEDFIAPLKARLDKTGLKYSIKGRTKSINSIWNKMQKQGIDVNGMYDLFAVRIIIDTELENEKRDCWMAFAEVTSEYTSNTSRFKDWITIPKSNGYESLHITVYGPNEQWVEVQIRTTRMDEIAERGLAAHWRYKGVKSEGDLDQWMNNVRDVLEAGSQGQLELIKNMKLDAYDNEVFVFTPKGDLYKLPAGASLLDFAFHIHSNLGCTCIGGKVDGKNQRINYRLKSGDTIEILTSSTQTPRLDWLNFTVTGKARSKIKQKVNEQRTRDAELAKELVSRRFKNRKIEYDESVFMRLIKKLGFKQANDMYIEITAGNLDVNDLLEQYIALLRKEHEQDTSHESAENFVLKQHEASENPKADVLVIGNDIRGIKYKLSNCCHPIYGDKVVGFVASDGEIKIHRADCKNAQYMLSRFPYREIKTEWSGKVGAQFAVTLRVIGQDDIGIVTNISSVINKGKNTSLRSINIDSHDGQFHGYLVVGVSDTQVLNDLIKNIKTLKGVKDVQRET